MSELIRKDKLINWLYMEPLYNDSINDRTDIREHIQDMPTTTEAEIRAKAIDEFAEKLKEASLKGAFEYKPDKEKPWYKERSYCKVVGTRKIDEIADQMKKELIPDKGQEEEYEGERV